MYGDEDEGEPKGEVVNYALMTVVDFDPSCYEEACTNCVWMQAMKEKINSIGKNDTRELVELPKGKKHVGSK